MDGWTNTLTDERTAQEGERFVYHPQQARCKVMAGICQKDVCVPSPHHILLPLELVSFLTSHLRPGDSARLPSSGLHETLPHESPSLWSSARFLLSPENVPELQLGNHRATPQPGYFIRPPINFFICVGYRQSRRAWRRLNRRALG